MGICMNKGDTICPKMVGHQNIHHNKGRKTETESISFQSSKDKFSEKMGLKRQIRLIGNHNCSR